MITQGLPPRGGESEGSVEQKCESMNKQTDMRRQCRTSGQLTAKSVSIPKVRSVDLGDCAWGEAAEITPGDLVLCRGNATEGAERRPDSAGQKSAEGVLGYVVGRASEALRCRKAESTDRPRWKR